MRDSDTRRSIQGSEVKKPLRIEAQVFEKQTGFLQPRRFGTDAATPRRKVFGPDGNGVTRGGKKPVRTAAGAGGRRRRRKASARLRTAAKASAINVGRRRRREKASARSRTAAKAGIGRATVRIFPSGPARCFGIAPRGKRFTPAVAFANDDCQSFKGCRNGCDGESPVSSGEPGQFRWNGE